MKTRLLFCFILFFAAGLNKATAKVFSWVGGTGNWTTAANWSPSSAYPGQTGTTDTAYINVSSVTITLNSNITISRMASTTYGVSGITIQLAGSSVITINNGIAAASPNGTAVGITFTGTGTTVIGGTSFFDYQASVQISTGIAVSFIAGSLVNFSSQGGIINYGTLNLASCTLIFGYNSLMINSGRVNANNTLFTLSGTPARLNNTGIFNATSCTFNTTGSNITISNTNSGILTTRTCTFTGSSSNTEAVFLNSATSTDYGSTFTLSGNNGAIRNTGAGANLRMIGSIINFTGTNSGQSITNSGTFTADSGAVITLGTYNCPITNTGTFYAGISKSACTINLTGQNANINNSGIFIVGSTSVINPTGLTAAISNTGTFTLQSDQYGSATISALSATAIISGTFNVQRYITGGSLAYRGYRLLSSPVYANTVNGNNVYSINYLKSAMYLTATTTNGGFDNPVPANPTLYLYRENMTPAYTTFLNSNYRGINNINSDPTYSMDDAAYPSANIPQANGYLCFYRGSRSVASYTEQTKANYVPQNTTLTATGTLNTGQIIVKNWFTPALQTLSYTPTSPVDVRGYNLVGNPYPSSIDWDTFQTTANNSTIYGKDVRNYIYALDPVSHNYGVYVKGTPGGIGTNNVSRIIASGQGFFVVATSTSAQLIFNESAKTNTQVSGPTLLMGMPVATNTEARYLRLQLAKDSVNTEDILLRFSADANTTYNAIADAPYMQGFGLVNLCSLSSDNVPLAINLQPLPKNYERIILNVNAQTSGSYLFNMENIVGIPELFDIWLIDHYKQDSTNMRRNAIYNFDIIKSDTNTFGSNRFALVIRQNPAYAYHLINFNAKKVAAAGFTRQVQLSWKTRNEQNYTHFTIERSTDNGQTYEVIGGMTSSTTGIYSLVDSSPADENLYRLRSEDFNNNITYSDIIPIGYSNLSNNLARSIKLYPNPAKNLIYLAVAVSNTSAISYDIQITNIAGLIMKRAISVQPTWQGSVADLMPGTYILKVFNSKNQLLIGNTKFVKL